MRNLFSSLNKYLVRQDENFLTEGLTYVLDILVSREPQAGNEILRLICSEKIDIDSTTLSITTQETMETGRPDLVISQGNDFTFFIEIKHDSTIGFTQLERYFEKLAIRTGKEKRLILITRSKHSLRETQLDRKNFSHLCWYQISGWLSELKLEDQVSKFTVDQFLNFLEEKEMTSERVGWDYIRGIPSLVHLSNMLETALTEAFPEEEIRRSAGWKEFGFYFGKEKDGWLGIEYTDHLNVYVAKAGPKQWFDELFRPLNLEKSHFFALEAGEQLEMLIKFISESVKELGITLEGEV
jgi:hypothetical protein